MDIIRRVLEPWTPYDQSVQWQIHRAFYATCGVSVWEHNVVPSLATSNLLAAEQQARVVIALVRSLIEEGGLGPDEPVDILEVGCGSGAFAVHFHEALDRSLGHEQEALTRRIRYVLSDASPHTVVQAIDSQPALPALIEDGRVVPALLDIASAEGALALGGQPLAMTPRVIIANYVACVLPCKQLRRSASTRVDDWEELLVELALEVPASSPQVKRDPRDILHDFLDNPSSESFLGDLGRAYHWKTIELDALFAEPIHAALARHIAAEVPGVVFAYPQVLVDFLGRMQAALPRGSYVLINDFGMAARETLIRQAPWSPVFYGNTLNHGLCFPLFDALSRETAWRVWRTRDSLQAVHHAVLRSGAEVPGAIADALHRVLVADTRADDYVDYMSAAHTSARAGDVSVALRFYRRAAELAPRDLETACQLAAHATDTGHAHVAVEYLLKSVDHAKSSEEAATALFELGRAYAELGRYRDALRAFSSSLAYDDRAQTHAHMAAALRARQRNPG